MGAGATALTTVELSKPPDASELSDAGAVAELRQLHESIARMEALSAAVRPILSASHAGDGDARAQVASLRQAMASVLNQPADAVLATAAAARSAASAAPPAPAVATAAVALAGASGVPHSVSLAEGVGALAAVDRVQLFWSSWWQESSGGDALPEGGFRVLLRKAKPEGEDPAAWAFVPVPKLHSRDDMKTIRSKGGLERGAAYELQVQAMADGKVTHSSPVMKVATAAASVVNVCANPGAQYIDAWWRYEGPGLQDETWTDEPVKFLLLVRPKPGAGEKPQGWRWIEAMQPPTADAPLRLSDASIKPDTEFELCVRCTLLGQAFETEPVQVQTASQGPAATGLGGSGDAEALSVWWSFDTSAVEGDASHLQYLVCVRQADAGDHAKWNYLSTGTVHTPDSPFRYEIAGGLIPNENYAVCIKVELPDGSITTSDVLTIATDPTKKVAELAKQGQAQKAEVDKINAAAAQQKHSALEEKLAKRRAARAAARADA